MSDEKIESVDFHHIKTNDFKTSYASGILGSITPNGMLNINFYIDRSPIPDLVTMSLKNGSAPKETNRNTRSGIVREVQTGIIVDINTAQNIVTAIQTMIDKYRAFKSQEEETK